MWAEGVMWGEVVMWGGRGDVGMWDSVVMCGALGMYGFSGVGVQWKCGWCGYPEAVMMWGAVVMMWGAVVMWGEVWVMWGAVMCEAMVMWEWSGDVWV